MASRASCCALISSLNSSRFDFFFSDPFLPKEVVDLPQVGLAVNGLSICKKVLKVAELKMKKKTIFDFERFFYFN